MAEAQRQGVVLEASEPALDLRLEALIEAVRRVFAEKGFDRASMQDLARAAEMSAGNFYRYFPSKDAIIEALVRRELAQIEAQFQQVMQAKDPLSLLRQTLHAHLDTFDRHDCAIWMEVLVSSNRHAPIGLLYQALMTSITDYLVQAFALAHAMPADKARHLFAAHAEMIFLLVQGVHLNRIRHHGTISPGVIAIAHRTLDLYLSEISRTCSDWTGQCTQDRDHV